MPELVTWYIDLKQQRRPRGSPPHPFSTSSSDQWSLAVRGAHTRPTEKEQRIARWQHRSVATPGRGNTGVYTPLTVWPIWENQFWPLTRVHRVHKRTQHIVQKNRFNHSVQRSTIQVYTLGVQIKQVLNFNTCTVEYNTGVHSKCTK